MSENPILFSGPMVKAIIHDFKTQTRRVVTRSNSLVNGKPASKELWDSLDFSNERACVLTVYGHGVELSVPENGFSNRYSITCRRHIGDLLWVREAWRVGIPHNGRAPNEILPHVQATGHGVTVLYECGGWCERGHAQNCVYPVDVELPQWAGKGRPSIHMPRAFSRLDLIINGVRAQRLQDITDDDAIQEGVDRTNTSLRGYAKERFHRLWLSINGEESWNENPFVWIYNFKKVRYG